MYFLKCINGTYGHRPKIKVTHTEQIRKRSFSLSHIPFFVLGFKIISPLKESLGTPWGMSILCPKTTKFIPARGKHPAQVLCSLFESFLNCLQGVLQLNPREKSITHNRSAHPLFRQPDCLLSHLSVCDFFSTFRYEHWNFLRKSAQEPWYSCLLSKFPFLADKPG